MPVIYSERDAYGLDLESSNQLKVIRNLLCYVILALFVASCTFHPVADNYERVVGSERNYKEFTETDYYVVFLTAAQYLDYSDHDALISTVRHIGNPLKGNVGHSWLYIHGIRDGKPVVLEGGHSHSDPWKGPPGYFTGVINLNLYGYADPDDRPSDEIRYEPNPIKYLWVPRNSGYFLPGSGGHSPTFAAKVDLTKELFERVMVFIDEKNYDYTHFSIFGNQCTALVTRVAALVGLEVESAVTMKIPPKIELDGHTYRLWTDPKYSEVIMPSPDVLEVSLRSAVQEGRAQYALDWYLN